MKALGHEKGDISLSMGFILALVVGFVIVLALPFAMSQTMGSAVYADTTAKNLGATFDVACLSQGNVTIKSSCPTDKIFIIEGNSITVISDSTFGVHTAQYYYMFPPDAVFDPNPKKVEVNCGLVNINKVFLKKGSVGKLVVIFEVL